MSARRLMIVLMNTDPRNTEELAAPFYYAAVAAAMDHQVDVICTATAGKLMLKGVAEALHVKPGDPEDRVRLDQGGARSGRDVLGVPGEPRAVRQVRSRSHSGMQRLMGAAAMVQDHHGRRLQVLTF